MPNDFSSYDAYIGGTGVIFYETPDIHPTYETYPLQPQRQDIGDNPLEQRPDFGDMFAQADFSHGAGQEYYHHPNRDPRKFYYSDGFDISKPGRLRHLQDVAAAASTGSGPLSLSNSVVFIGNGNTIQRSNGAFPGTWTNDSPHAGESATTVLDLASSGDELYAALGANGIHKRDSSGTWTHFSNVQANQISWLKNRLIAGDGRNIYEITAATPNPSALEQLPQGWTFSSFFESGAFIYATCYSTSNGQSEVHAYSLNQSLTGLEPRTSNPMPRNQLAFSGYGYLGTLYIGAGKVTSAGGYDPVVYQAFPDANGAIQLIKLVEDQNSGANDLSVSAIETVGEAVVFGFSLTSTSTTGLREGLGIHYLGRDALGLHLAKASPSATPKKVTDIRQYQGRLLFVVAGDGLYYEDLTKYRAAAKIVPSVADWNSAGQKAWDFLRLSHRPLPAGTSVVAEYTLKHPDENSWNAGVTSNTTAAEGVEQLLTNAKSRLFDLRITSNANGAQTSAPEFIGFEVRSIPVPTSSTEYKLTRYIRVLDHDRKDEQANVVYNDPDTLRNSLLNLAFTKTTLEEPDRTWNVFVQDVSIMEPDQPLIDATTGESREDAFVMQITMVGS